MKHWTVAGIRQLCCLVLFGAPFAEAAMPGGDVYLACMAGIVAFAGIAAEAWCGRTAFVPGKTDFLFGACLVYAAARMPLPVDAGLCVKLVAMAGIWCYVRLQNTPEFRRTAALWMIAGGTVQATIGLLQGLGAQDSFHSEFAVTGTFVNPDPFGGYLAVVAALLLPYVLQAKTSVATRTGWCACLAIVVAALVWADSRAAWCAACVAILLYFLMETPARKRALKTGTAVLLATAIPVAVMLLYHYRPGSADARLLIWRVCREIFAQSPLAGVGTGRLAAHYMPAQAEYLMAATETVRRNAADNLLAYNETLTVLCEQGLTGFLLAAAFWTFVLRGMKASFQSDDRDVFLFPTVALLVFAQFSYPLSLWSLACLFPFLAAIGTKQAQGKGLDATQCRRTYCRRMFPIILPCLCGALLATGFTLRWRAQAWVHDYATFSTAGECPKGAVGWMLRHDPYLLDCHTEAAFLRTDYETALRQAERLDSYARTARQAMRQGECHKETGDTLKALACYQEAARMMPGLMYPAFAEFDLYRKTSQKEKGLRSARKLSRFHPKVENRRTRLMREEARRYLRHEGK